MAKSKEISVKKKKGQSDSSIEVLAELNDLSRLKNKGKSDAEEVKTYKDLARSINDEQHIVNDEYDIPNNYPLKEEQSEQVEHVTYKKGGIRDILSRPNKPFQSMSEEIEPPASISPEPLIKPKKKMTRKQKIFLGVFTILTFLISVGGVLAYSLVYQPLNKIKGSFENIQVIVGNMATDLEKKDLSKLEDNFDQVNLNIQTINQQVDKLDYLSSLDSTKGYYENLQIFSTTLTKTEALLNKTLPDLKNLLKITGFRVDKDQSVASIDKKKKDKPALVLILSEMPGYLKLYSSIEPQLLDIFAEVKKIDPNYIPEIPGTDLKDKYNKFVEFSLDFPEISKKTTEFLKYVPSLVGSKKATNYLLILQNETEMRGSGGIISSYGNMALQEGEIKGDIKLTDTWTLQRNIIEGLGLNPGYYNIYGQAFLMNLGCGGYSARAQDVPMYPDLNWSMNAFSDYYDFGTQYDPKNYPKYDHIVMINLEFAENLLKLIQPLEVKGFGKVTAESLFDFINVEKDRPEIANNADRKKIIAQIANAAQTKFENLPADTIPKIVELLIKSFKAKDIALFSPNKSMQSFFDKYLLSGRTVNNFKGDYFQLNEAQNCSLKLNKFVRNTVDMDINIANDGSVSKNVHINWTQKEYFLYKRRYQYSQLPTHTYRAWVRLFTPKDSFNFVSDGRRASNWFPYNPENYFDDVMQKQTNDNVIQFDQRRFTKADPIRTQDLTVSYQLPKSLNYTTSKGFNMLLQKHPGKSWGEVYTIKFKYKGKTHTSKITLDQDKIVSFKDDKIKVTNYNTSLDWISNIFKN